MSVLRALRRRGGSEIGQVPLSTGDREVLRIARERSATTDDRLMGLREEVLALIRGREEDQKQFVTLLELERSARLHLSDELRALIADEARRALTHAGLNAGLIGELRQDMRVAEERIDGTLSWVIRFAWRTCKAAVLRMLARG